MPISVPQAVNKVLGAGKLYFDDGSGYRYLMETPGFNVTTASTKVTDESSDGPIAETDVEIFTKITRTAKITCKDISSANLGIFVVGAAGSVAQAAGAVVAEAHDAVQQGRYYQLGASADDTNPTGVRGISAVAVKNDASPPHAYVLDADYQLDTDLGLVYVIPGGGITDDTNLRVNYTTAMNSREQVVANNLEPVEGRLKFIADNTNGENRDLFAPKVRLMPNGDWALKDRANIQMLSFDAEFKTPTDGSGQVALYIDGRPA